MADYERNGVYLSNAEYEDLLDDAERPDPYTLLDKLIEGAMALGAIVISLVVLYVIWAMFVSDKIILRC